MINFLESIHSCVMCMNIEIALSVIYTIIRLKSVSQATFADCRSQFLLDRLGRCLKLIVSYRGTSSHEFASQFGLAFFFIPVDSASRGSRVGVGMNRSDREGKKCKAL